MATYVASIVIRRIYRPVGRTIARATILFLVLILVSHYQLSSMNSASVGFVVGALVYAVFLPTSDAKGVSND